jgi:hypothetical protein
MCYDFRSSDRALRNSSELLVCTPHFLLSRKWSAPFARTDFTMIATSPPQHPSIPFPSPYCIEDRTIPPRAPSRSDILTVSGRCIFRERHSIGDRDSQTLPTTTNEVHVRIGLASVHISKHEVSHGSQPRQLLLTTHIMKSHGWTVLA